LAPARADQQVAQAQSFPGGIATVFVIAMENHNWSSIRGSSSAPYINSLLTRADASYASQYYNPPRLHPSEPNYIWMEAGSNRLQNGATTITFTDDTDPSPHHSSSTTDHLTTYLNRAGITWKAYAEGAPGTSCPLSYQGQKQFEPDHVPFVFFQDVTNNNSQSSSYCIAHIRPFSELATDVRNNTLPRYSFSVPTSCDDMHDSCAPFNDPIKQGDTWLSKNLPTILNSRAYANGGAVFLVWDEAAIGDGPIPMIVLSRSSKGHGYTNSVHYDHSSLLRSLEEIFGVSPMLRNAASATDLSDLFSGSLGHKPTPTSTPTPTATSTPSSAGTPRTDLAIAFAEASGQIGGWSVPSPYQLVVNWNGSTGARPVAIADAPISVTGGTVVPGPTITNASAQSSSGGSLVLISGANLAVHGAIPASYVYGASPGTSATIAAPKMQAGDVVLVYLDTPDSITAPSGWTQLRHDGEGTVWAESFTSLPTDLGTWTMAGAHGWTYTAVAVGGASASVDASGGGGMQTSKVVQTGSATVHRHSYQPGLQCDCALRAHHPE
jgi:hypothetical protein